MGNAYASPILPSTEGESKMAKAGDGRTRSSRRHRDQQIKLNLTSEETQLIDFAVNRLNQSISRDRSARPFNRQRLIMDLVYEALAGDASTEEALKLRRLEQQVPAILPAPKRSILDQESAAAIASVCNALFTWVTYGKGAFAGKNTKGQSLRVGSDPDEREEVWVNRILADLKAIKGAINGPLTARVTQ
jgi:hypothetical protein